MERLASNKNTRSLDYSSDRCGVGHMYVLIDTNIFISREADRITPPNLTSLEKILKKNNVSVIVHPNSVAELNDYENKVRRKIALSKIEAYLKLEKPPEYSKDETFVEAVNKGNTGIDDVDKSLLYAVCKNAVTFLITEDRGILSQANLLGIRANVLSVNEALNLFQKLFSEIEIIKPPQLKEDFVYNLDKTDPIFDSLRSEYGEFDTWLAKVAGQHRKCFTTKKIDGKLGAVEIYKEEDDTIDLVPTPLPKKMRLKISLMKVTDSGYRIGELLLKLAIRYSVEKDIDEIYLTHFTKPNDSLVSLISEYGFYKAGTNKRGEEVFVKHLKAPVGVLSTMSPIEACKKYYPSFYDGSKVHKFIIPIKPVYEETLFIDFYKKGIQARLGQVGSQFAVEGNTIKKVYLTQSNIKKIGVGDIVLFYRTENNQLLLALGVVENLALGVSKIEELLKFIGNRTVYPATEIETMLKRNEITAISFIWITYFKNKITERDLKEMGAFERVPMSVMQITEDAYQKIKDKGGIDASYIIN